jgi:uncharacterized protein YfcZ (UPF0381/DUF406 family)
MKLHAFTNFLTNFSVNFQQASQDPEFVVKETAPESSLSPVKPKRDEFEAALSHLKQKTRQLEVETILMQREISKRKA